MKDSNHSDDWRSLCELASKEMDPQKLLDLISKINRALEECRQRKQPEEVSLRVDVVLLEKPAKGTDLIATAFPETCRQYRTIENAGYADIDPRSPRFGS